VKRCLTVAADALQRVTGTRAVQMFALLFAAMALALSYFGLAGQRTAGFQGFTRVTASLSNLVVYVVPLIALTVGVTEVTGRRKHLSVILAQPVLRWEVLLGSYIGVAGALVAALAIGLGGAGLLIAIQTNASSLGGYLVLMATSVGLLLAFLSLAFLIGVVLLDRLKAMAAALVAWFAAVVGYDLFVIGVSSLLKGVALKSILLPAILLNPVDITRVLVMLSSGRGALFGPAGAVLVDVMGRPPGAIAAGSALLAQIVAPLVIAVLVFRRRDL